MSTKARQDGEGSIYRSDGYYVAQVAYIDPATGNRRHRRVKAKKRSDAAAALKEMLKRAEAGQPLRDATITVGEWTKHWEASSLAMSPRRDTTKLTYRTLAKTLIRPYLGAVPLNRLRASDVEKWLVDLEAAGKKASTRRQALTILRAALDSAVRDGHLAVNPTVQVSRPRQERIEAKHYEVDEIAKLLEAAQGHRHRMLLVTLIGSGLRRGEALALQWENVDLENAELRVRGTLVRTERGLVVNPPKTAKGWRTVPLSPPVVAALRAQRKQQLEEQLAAGVSWVRTPFVFTTEAGTPLDPRNISRWFSELARRAGVGGSMHATRHTSLTSMVNAGVPMAVVSRVAGHESITTTVDLYGHVSERAARDAVAAAASALGLG
jgi:integrase